MSAVASPEAAAVATYAPQIGTARDPSQTPPRRGRPPSLTEDQIAETALRLSNKGGFENLSMRGLAAKLGVPVMTIYNYVPNKRALFDLISDHLLRPVEVPPRDAGSWDVRMRILQRATRAAVARHTGVRLSSGAIHSAEAARLAQGAMSILADGGFTPTQAERAFSTLFTFMLGQMEVDAAATRLADHATDPSPFGRTSAEGDDLFEFSFDVLIDGLQARLHPRKR